MSNILPINTLRLIVKARKYVFGETLILDIRTNKVSLVVIANDAGDASKKKLIDKCTSFNVQYIECLDKNTLQNVFNRNISAIGIKDENLAHKFLENIQK